MKKPALVLALLAATTASASAQPRDHARPHKSVVVARGASVAATLLGAAVIAGGRAWFDAHPTQAGADQATAIGIAGGAVMFLGPTAGDWYGGKLLTRGLEIRAGGAAAIAGGFALAMSECGQDGCKERTFLPGAIVAGVGALAVIGGAVLDFVDAGPTVRAWNRRHDVDAIVTPTVMQSNGHAAPALAVVGRF